MTPLMLVMIAGVSGSVFTSGVYTRSPLIIAVGFLMCAACGAIGQVMA